MARLFELFVARWLEENLGEQYMLKCQEQFYIGDAGALKVRMDMVLCDRESGQSLCILETKYKAHSKVDNEDYYQAVAYADVAGCANAFLVYPRELACPFDEKPGVVRVRTAVFDLSDDLDRAGRRLLGRLHEAL